MLFLRLPHLANCFTGFQLQFRAYESKVYPPVLLAELASVVRLNVMGARSNSAHGYRLLISGNRAVG